MFIKCLLLLFILGFIDARYQSYSYRSCPMPHLENGRIRSKPNTKLIKFICNSKYFLVGNRYGSCRNNGEWDVPMPVCVRSGCRPLPRVPKSIQISTHNDAWVHIWCLDGYKMIGSWATYCNGTHWNATVPTCIDSKTKNQLRCDFEDPNICGWTQDELHDFDWKRHNMQTPSSYHFTGPSYDHTFGEGGSGYYMYIESTSRMENDKARLLSPIYDAALSIDGCFLFYYHMFGQSVGGLRVYQKPDSLQLYKLLNLNDAEKGKYLLFEQWGNQNNIWYSAAPQLRNVSDSFQIVIEGIRGKGFTSDIAIDDVAILHGDNCTAARNYATTPTSFLSESCSGRCDFTGELAPSRGCGCTVTCIIDDNCCPDFADLCLFDGVSAADEDAYSPTHANTSLELPQTQKLVAITDTTSTSTSTSTTSTPSIPTPRSIPITPSTPSWPRIPKIRITPSTPSSPSIPTIPITASSSISHRIPKVPITPSTSSSPSIITIPSTPRTPSRITTTTTTTLLTNKINTTKPTINPVPPAIMPVKFVNKTVLKPFTDNSKIISKKIVPTPKPTIITSKPEPTTKTTTTVANSITNTIDNHMNPDLIEQKKKMEDFKTQNGHKNKQVDNKSSLKTTIIIIVVLALCACGVWAITATRGARGCVALARLRALSSNDSEVQYLNTDVDDDLYISLNSYTCFIST